MSTWRAKVTGSITGSRLERENDRKLRASESSKHIPPPGPPPKGSRRETPASRSRGRMWTWTWFLAVMTV